MKRLTVRNYKNTTLDLESCKPYLKLGRIEDMEESVNHSIEEIVDMLKNGYIDRDGNYHKQCYLCYLDDEWCICDLLTDEWESLSEAFKYDK